MFSRSDGTFGYVNDEGAGIGFLDLGSESNGGGGNSGDDDTLMASLTH